jgi:hypothetical protein
MSHHCMHHRNNILEGMELETGKNMPFIEEGTLLLQALLRNCSLQLNKHMACLEYEVP